MHCGVKLENISFSFKEICEVAQDIKPNNWCIVTSDQRLTFIEIILPQFGPATLQRQLIVNNYLQIEAYVATKRVCDDFLKLNDIKSVSDLKKCLKDFASFGICLGNRNFKKETTKSSETDTEYWRHAKCLLLYKNTQKVQCCDMCLRLNGFLTKEQRQQIFLNQNSNSEELPESKRIKTEIEDDENTYVEVT